MRWTLALIALVSQCTQTLAVSQPLVQRATPLETRGSYSSGYRSVAYYVDWAIYSRQHYPVDIPVKDLTHVLYSFAKISNQTGTVELADPWADNQIQLKNLTDPDLDPKANNVHGCVEQLYLLKKQNRNLKVMLSIGGYSYSQGLNGTFTDANIQRFTDSAISLVKTYGFDGLDLDWEFPADAKDAQAFVKILKSLRAGLDGCTSKWAPGMHFELSAAVSAGASHYKVLDMKAMDKYLDFWNLMAYDYAGPWDLLDSKTSGHQSNIYGKTSATTKFNTVDAVDYYTSHIPSSKLVLLMPLYGHVFQGTKGPGQPFTGFGSVDPASKVWEAGSIDYSVLPKPGAVEHYDPKLIASWSYDPATSEMISYDNDQAACDKVKWMKSRKLGGVGFWETSGDKKGEKSRIKLVVNKLGGAKALQKKQNWLDYSESPYANLRAKKTYGSQSTSSHRRRHLHGSIHGRRNVFVRSS